MSDSTMNKAINEASSGRPTQQHFDDSGELVADEGAEDYDSDEAFEESDDSFEG